MSSTASGAPPQPGSSAATVVGEPKIIKEVVIVEEKQPDGSIVRKRITRTRKIIRRTTATPKSQDESGSERPSLDSTSGAGDEPVLSNDGSRQLTPRVSMDPIDELGAPDATTATDAAPNATDVVAPAAPEDAPADSNGVEAQAESAPQPLNPPPVLRVDQSSLNRHLALLRGLAGVPTFAGPAASPTMLIALEERYLKWLTWLANEPTTASGVVPPPDVLAMWYTHVVCDLTRYADDLGQLFGHESRDRILTIPFPVDAWSNDDLTSRAAWTTGTGLPWSLPRQIVTMMHRDLTVPCPGCTFPVPVMIDRYVDVFKKAQGAIMCLRCHTTIDQKGILAHLQRNPDQRSTLPLFRFTLDFDESMPFVAAQVDTILANVGVRLDEDDVAAAMAAFLDLLKTAAARPADTQEPPLQAKPDVLLVYWNALLIPQDYLDYSLQNHGKIVILNQEAIVLSAIALSNESIADFVAVPGPLAGDKAVADQPTSGNDDSADAQSPRADVAESETAPVVPTIIEDMDGHVAAAAAGDAIPADAASPALSVSGLSPPGSPLATSQPSISSIKSNLDSIEKQVQSLAPSAAGKVSNARKIKGPSVNALRAMFESSKKPKRQIQVNIPGPVEESAPWELLLSKESLEAHLDLIESFSMHLSLARHQDKAHEGKIDTRYLLKAENRYYKWLVMLSQGKIVMPPVDVLLLWYNHMTHLPIYHRDLAAIFGDAEVPTLLVTPFPLLQFMIQTLNRQIDGAAQAAWEKFTGQPYVLLHNADVIEHPWLLQCPACCSYFHVEVTEFVKLRLAQSGIECAVCSRVISKQALLLMRDPQLYTAFAVFSIDLVTTVQNWRRKVLSQLVEVRRGVIDHDKTVEQYRQVAWPRSIVVTDAAGTTESVYHLEAHDWTPKVLLAYFTHTLWPNHFAAASRAQYGALADHAVEHLALQDAGLNYHHWDAVRGRPLRLRKTAPVEEVARVTNLDDVVVEDNHAISLHVAPDAHPLFPVITVEALDDIQALAPLVERDNVPALLEDPTQLLLATQRYGAYLHALAQDPSLIDKFVLPPDVALLMQTHMSQPAVFQRDIMALTTDRHVRQHLFAIANPWRNATTEATVEQAAHWAAATHVPFELSTTTVPRIRPESPVSMDLAPALDAFVRGVLASTALDVDDVRAAYINAVDKSVVVTLADGTKEWYCITDPSVAAAVGHLVHARRADKYQTWFKDTYGIDVAELAPEVEAAPAFLDLALSEGWFEDPADLDGASNEELVEPMSDVLTDALWTKWQEMEADIVTSGLGEKCRDPGYIQAAIDRYEQFLATVPNIPALLDLPLPVDVALVMQTHMANPIAFRHDVDALVADATARQRLLDQASPLDHALTRDAASTDAQVAWAQITGQVYDLAPAKFLPLPVATCPSCATVQSVDAIAHAQGAGRCIQCLNVLPAPKSALSVDMHTAVASFLSSVANLPSTSLGEIRDQYAHQVGRTVVIRHGDEPAELYSLKPPSPASALGLLVHTAVSPAEYAAWFEAQHGVPVTEVALPTPPPPPKTPVSRLRLVPGLLAITAPDSKSAATPDSDTAVDYSPIVRTLETALPAWPSINSHVLMAMAEYADFVQASVENLESGVPAPALTPRVALVLLSHLLMVGNVESDLAHFTTSPRELRTALQARLLNEPVDTTAAPAVPKSGPVDVAPLVPLVCHLSGLVAVLQRALDKNTPTPAVPYARVFADAMVIIDSDGLPQGYSMHFQPEHGVPHLHHVLQPTYAAECDAQLGCHGTLFAVAPSRDAAEVLAHLAITELDEARAGLPVPTVVKQVSVEAVDRFNAVVGKIVAELVVIDDAVVREYAAYQGYLTATFQKHGSLNKVATPSDRVLAAALAHATFADAYLDDLVHLGDEDGAVAIAEFWAALFRRGDAPGDAAGQEAVDPTADAMCVSVPTRQLSARMERISQIAGKPVTQEAVDAYNHALDRAVLVEKSSDDTPELYTPIDLSAPMWSAHLFHVSQFPAFAALIESRFDYVATFFPAEPKLVPSPVDRTAAEAAQEQADELDEDLQLTKALLAAISLEPSGAAQAAVSSEKLHSFFNHLVELFGDLNDLTESDILAYFDAVRTCSVQNGDGEDAELLLLLHTTFPARFRDDMIAITNSDDDTDLHELYRLLAARFWTVRRLLLSVRATDLDQGILDYERALLRTVVVTAQDGSQTLHTVGTLPPAALLVHVLHMSHRAVYYHSMMDRFGALLTFLEDELADETTIKEMQDVSLLEPAADEEEQDVASDVSLTPVLAPIALAGLGAGLGLGLAEMMDDADDETKAVAPVVGQVPVAPSSQIDADLERAVDVLAESPAQDATENAAEGAADAIEGAVEKSASAQDQEPLAEDEPLLDAVESVSAAEQEAQDAAAAVESASDGADVAAGPAYANDAVRDASLEQEAETEDAQARDAAATEPSSNADNAATGASAGEEVDVAVTEPAQDRDAAVEPLAEGQESGELPEDEPNVHDLHEEDEFVAAELGDKEVSVYANPQDEEEPAVAKSPEEEESVAAETHEEEESAQPVLDVEAADATKGILEFTDAAPEPDVVTIEESMVTYEVLSGFQSNFNNAARRGWSNKWPVTYAKFVLDLSKNPRADTGVELDTRSVPSSVRLMATVHASMPDIFAGDLAALISANHVDAVTETLAHAVCDPEWSDEANLAEQEEELAEPEPTDPSELADRLHARFDTIRGIFDAATVEPDTNVKYQHALDEAAVVATPDGRECLATETPLADDVLLAHVFHTSQADQFRAFMVDHFGGLYGFLPHEEPVERAPVDVEVFGEPAAEEPVAEEPVVEEPVVEEPIVEQPAAVEPIAEPKPQDPETRLIGDVIVTRETLMMAPVPGSAKPLPAVPQEEHPREPEKFLALNPDTLAAGKVADLDRNGPAAVADYAIDPEPCPEPGQLREPLTSKITGALVDRYWRLLRVLLQIETLHYPALLVRSESRYLKWLVLLAETHRTDLIPPVDVALIAHVHAQFPEQLRFDLDALFGPVNAQAILKHSILAADPIHFQQDVEAESQSVWESFTGEPYFYHHARAATAYMLSCPSCSTIQSVPEGDLVSLKSEAWQLPCPACDTTSSLAELRKVNRGLAPFSINFILQTPIWRARVRKILQEAKRQDPADVAARYHHYTCLATEVAAGEQREVYSIAECDQAVVMGHATHLLLPSWYQDAVVDWFDHWNILVKGDAPVPIIPERKPRLSSASAAGSPPARTRTLSVTTTTTAITATLDAAAVELTLQPEEVVAYARLVRTLLSCPDFPLKAGPRSPYWFRAEKRYLAYLSVMEHAVVEGHALPLPPLDVLLLWLVHLMDPQRYIEDIIRNFGDAKMLAFAFPLDKVDMFLSIHQGPVMAEAWAGFVPVSHSDSWTSFTREPFVLLRDQPVTYTVVCPFCHEEQSWSEELYVAMRTGSQVVFCRCNKWLTLPTLSAWRLVEDLRRAGKGQGHIAGTLFNLSKGKVDYRMAHSVQRLLYFTLPTALTEVLETPLVTEPDVINPWKEMNLTGLVQEYVRSAVQRQYAGKHKHKASVIAAQILTSYQNVITDLSVDLIQNVVSWAALTRELLASSLPETQDPTVVAPAMVDRYMRYLQLVSDYRTGAVANTQEPKRPLFPAPDMLLVHQCHLLSAVGYQKFCVNRFGKLLDYSRLDVKSAIERDADWMKSVWAKRNPDPFWPIAAPSKQHRLVRLPGRAGAAAGTPPVPALPANSSSLPPRASGEETDTSATPSKKKKKGIKKFFGKILGRK
ncbi:hypothetical protein AMAG_00521 [Allomyces macrogynus ATCC 38327]|uniref:Uncharacterized protein n=1 Tax=Allomyces macrogynus (strain ATCC 38327) TaxID=578462 RepID=A0A0L0RVX8_ALLM3|nr:hypothetical protein AMAG_00521 [Allomyces macrogynus ATCC 38327]|eukprot:KNE54552.1 hypothetical protein AMAG_00521 [Allomyces macrogynus ATCC 38327]